MREIGKEYLKVINEPDLLPTLEEYGSGFYNAIKIKNQFSDFLLTEEDLQSYGLTEENEELSKKRRSLKNKK